MKSKLVYVCSPYRGETEKHRKYAKELTRAVLEAGGVPVTPHLYIALVLDDEEPEERKLGLSAGHEPLKSCPFILIGGKFGISEGMRGEIELARKIGTQEVMLKDGKLVKAERGGYL